MGRDPENRELEFHSVTSISVVLSRPISGKQRISYFVSCSCMHSRPLDVVGHEWKWSSRPNHHSQDTKPSGVASIGLRGRVRFGNSICSEIPIEMTCLPRAKRFQHTRIKMAANAGSQGEDESTGNARRTTHQTPIRRKMSPHRPNDWSLESGGRYTEQRETESIAGFGRIPYTKTSEFAGPIALSESPAPRGRRPKPPADEAISSIVAEKGTRIGEDEQVKRYDSLTRETGIFDLVSRSSWGSQQSLDGSPSSRRVARSLARLNDAGDRYFRVRRWPQVENPRPGLTPLVATIPLEDVQTRSRVQGWSKTGMR